MLGFTIDTSKISFKDFEDDLATDETNSISSLAEGLPTHEEINGNTHIDFDGPLLTLQNRQVSSINNGLLIIAPQKTGKSQVCEAIAASVVVTSPDITNPEANLACDTLGFKFIPPIDSEGNTDHRGCLYIDTERSRNQFKKGFERIARRTGVKKDEAGRLPKLKTVSLFGCMDTMEARKIIESYLVQNEFCFLILDGSADFVSDENDNKESKNFVRWLITLSAKFRIGYVVTIHPNPNDPEGKGTGHLGTFLAKKLEAIVNMFYHANDKSKRLITSETSQGGTRNDDSQINQVIVYDKNEWMFMSSYDDHNQSEPWIEALRNRKFMDYDDFVIMYDEMTRKGKIRTLASVKKEVKDMIERKMIIEISGRVSLPDKNQMIKQLSIEEEIPEEGEFPVEKWNPNKFVSYGDPEQERELF